MTFTFQLEDGKRVVCDTKADTQIYDAPHNPPNTGTAYTRGVDLYAHRTKGGALYFYAYYWSMWQAEDSTADLWPKDKVEAFLISRMSGPYHERPSDSEIETLREFGIDLTEETA